ncbi:MAG: TrbI/VirB10 family protein [Proteobacteria bacterium]|nr:TrbI/VirB10 family protein [Pseudomonadota bacterium]
MSKEKQSLDSMARSDNFNLNPKPDPVTKIRKTVVISIVVIISIAVLFSIQDGLSNNKGDKANLQKKDEVKVSKVEMLPNSIVDIPNDYTEAAKRKRDIEQQNKANRLRYGGRSFDEGRAQLASKAYKEEMKAVTSNMTFQLNDPYSNTSSSNSYQKPSSANMPFRQASGSASGVDYNLDPVKAQNGQIDKKNFRRNSRQNDVYSSKLIEHPVSDYQVNAGSIIPASLISGINSDLPGDVIAQVRENVYDTVSGNYLMIPQGTKIVGEYDSNVSYGQNRVLLVWDRLQFPDGSTLLLENMGGSDLAGYGGLKDKVDNHTLKIMTAVLFSSLLNVGVTELDNQSNTFAIDTAEGINEAAQEIVKKQLNVQPTIKIRPGYSFNIVVNKNMVLEKYIY